MNEADKDQYAKDFQKIEESQAYCKKLLDWVSNAAAAASTKPSIWRDRIPTGLPCPVCAPKIAVPLAEATLPPEDPTAKRSNPKDIVGSDKVPLHLWPATATTLGAMALLDGALKYGRSNFRVVGVRASIYYDAVNRHINAWFEGEDDDPDSGLPHLAHALACLAVIVDAQAAGVLRDDRMTPGGYRAWIDGLTPHVRRLREKHADKSPRHYTREGASRQTTAPEKEGTRK